MMTLSRNQNAETRAGFHPKRIVRSADLNENSKAKQFFVRALSYEFYTNKVK
jgi:hypothetical protein